MDHLNVTFLPQGITVALEPGTTLLQAQIVAGMHPDAPCGGKGTCGKCNVEINGKTVLACQTKVFEDMTVTLPQWEKSAILTEGFSAPIHPDGLHDYAAAFDIGTTTLVGFLLDGRSGELLATASAMNPQFRYGADVIARIEAAITSTEPVLQQCILPVLQHLLQHTAATPDVKHCPAMLVPHLLHTHGNPMMGMGAQGGPGVQPAWTLTQISSNLLNSRVP